jgi:plastocyanin
MTVRMTTWTRGATLLVILGLMMLAPAHAQSSVTVKIPAGAGAGPNAAPGYAPDSVKVVIGVNNTVVWTNGDTDNGGTDHTVTSTSVPAGASSFDSGIMAAGATFTQTFTVPGTYQYHCSLHAWMTGMVVVEEGSPTPAPEFPASAFAGVLLVAMMVAIVVIPRARGNPWSLSANPAR